VRVVKLRRVSIRNFRLLEQLEVDLSPTTVVIGENNAGKSAFLDAIRLVLNRASARKGCAATEYDFNLLKDKTEPHTAQPIEISLLFREDAPSEWPVEVTQELNEIVQLDPHSGLNQIHVKYTASYNSGSKAFEQDVSFLNIEGQPLKTRTGSYAVFGDFLTYVPVFYLSALRDIDEQFSPRSPFWGRLLRSVDIPEAKRDEITKKLESLNAELLAVDPKLQKVTDNLSQISKVVAQYTKQEVALRALPLRPWDLMSRSEVVLQSHGSSTKFPLSKHGQGVQSLAVLFLFQAFIAEMLTTLYAEHASPILALEEPEAHLHPQAARALWRQVEEVPGQKLVTTHSPYFVQNVPFHDLRILRRESGTTHVFSLPEYYTANLLVNDELREFVKNNGGRFSLHADELRVTGTITEDECRNLLKCFVRPEEKQWHAVVRDLAERTKSYISHDDVLKLETYVRRMRGEILFARCWLLCEGQTEYALLHHFSLMLKLPLDANGVAVVDYQNNGSPGAFAALARVLGFKWMMFSDGDAAAKGFVKELKGLHFTDKQVVASVKNFPETDIEMFAAKSGLADDCRACLGEHSTAVAPKTAATAVDELSVALRSKKPNWAYWLIEKLSRRKAGAADVPDFFKKVIEEGVKLANE
jgi:putative ATP-dependent endonuclease of OLD family